MPDVNARSKPRLAEIKLEATQRAIVDAAGRLFAERGYVGTTMESIAADAGVAVQTIYNVVGSKRAVLSRMLDLIAAGARAPTPAADFLGDRIRNESEPERIVALLVDWFVEVNERAAPTFAVIRQAATVDPEVAALERERAERRLAGYAEAAKELAGRGGLRNGLSVEDAAATLWILGHPDTYRSLVLEYGWPIEGYRAWLRRTLGAALLR